LGGLIAIAFWSMVAVALSGVFGRYLYHLIPRKPNGEELNSEELSHWGVQGEAFLEGGPISSQRLATMFASLTQVSRKGPSLYSFAVHSWALRRKRQGLQQELLDFGLNAEAATGIAAALLHRARIHLRLRWLGDFRKLFHYWHVIHRPFALIMYIIMLVHVGIALAYGISWGVS
jgi:hypothetical protein